MVLKNRYSTISQKQQKLKFKTKYETEEERIDRLMSENFDPHYPNFESFRDDLCEKIEIALKEVDEGLGRPIEELFKEMEEKYGIRT